MLKHVLVLAVMGVAVLAVAWQAPGGAVRADTTTSEPEFVVVRLHLPAQLRFEATDRAAALTAVDAAQTRVLSALGPGDFEVSYRYRLLPALAGTVSPRGASILRAHPDVESVEADRRGHGGLAQSVPMINASDVQSLGYTGAGTVVAVIDSGVDSDHPDLADSLVHQECFMANPNLGSRCPNGGTYQVGSAAAEDDHGHGSNVTGVITSNGTVAPKGVAPGAQIAAFKIIDSSNNFWFSDLDAVLDHILFDHPEIDLINMSLGTFGTFPPGSCESGAVVYNALWASGKATFVASMNNGAKSSMGYPACVGSAISVGAVYDANVGSFSTGACSDTTTFAGKVACWSNSDFSLDLLGPGCGTRSAGRFNSTSVFCGTSQATPHAAGVAALLLQAMPSLTPAQIERSLELRAVPVTDGLNGLTKPRLDALLAFDFDGDGLLNPSDPDDDNEGVPDSVEIPCGSDLLLASSVPERVDTPADDDGDGQVNEGLPNGDVQQDCDGDGYARSAETNVETSDQDPCGGSGWPSDLVPGGLQPNTLNVQDVASFVTPVRRFGKSAGHPDFAVRWDLVPGGTIGGAINIQDVAAMVTGASGYPPMFGGLRAFARACPWAP